MKKIPELDKKLAELKSLGVRKHFEDFRKLESEVESMSTRLQQGLERYEKEGVIQTLISYNDLQNGEEFTPPVRVSDILGVGNRWAELTKKQNQIMGLYSGIVDLLLKIDDEETLRAYTDKLDKVFPGKSEV